MIEFLASFFGKWSCTVDSALGALKLLSSIYDSQLTVTNGAID